MITSHRSVLRPILFAAAALAAAGSLRAANVSWDITPGTVGPGDSAITGGAGTWNTTAGDWTVDGGVNDIAWVNANNDTAIFGGTGGIVTVGSAITVGGLNFSTAGYSLAGGTITLAAGTSINTAADVSIGSTLAAGANAWSKDGAGKLTLTTGISSGAQSLTVNAGTLSILTNAYNSLGATASSVTVNAGATLSLDGTSNNAHNLTNLTLNGGTVTSASGAEANIYGNIVLNGALTVGGSTASTISSKNLGLTGTRTFTVNDVTGDSAADLTVSAALITSSGSAAGGIIKAGAGTMTLTGTNTYAGTTTVNAGTLVVGTTGYLNSAAGIAVNNGAVLQVIGSGYGSVSTAAVITVNSGGTLRASGTNAISGVGLIVNAGGLATVDANVVITMGATTLSGGTLSGAGTNAYGNYFFNNTTITHTGDAASLIDAAGGIGVGGAVTISVADGAAANDLTISAAIRQPGAATSISKTGDGRLVLSGSNAFTGGLTISAGTLMTGHTAALGAGAVTVATGATLSVGNGTVKTVALASGAVLAINGTLKLDATLGTSTAAVALTAGSYNFNGTLDLSGVFNSAGAGSYTLITGGSGNVDTAVAITGYSGPLSASFSNGALVLAAVPEPATYGLLGAGVLGLAAFRRRRVKA